MRIKWIELNGFKSFPDRTKIELNEGITCFVGPNGAGKSNVIDAFRWILGEHNPRALRGEKMEDVIFQGSQSKKEKGLAEVTLLINLPEEGENGSKSKLKEVEIRRRFYRTGESYFLINGKQSRLKDIKEFFISEGVDIKTYSIIDQFKINEILSKPSHRKNLLEECAGISIYKLKRAESEDRLSSARENLQRIEDILRELEKQYRLLERQAKRAEKYRKVLNELTTLELQVAKADSTELLNSIEEIEREIKSLTIEKSSLKEENGNLSSQIRKVKGQLVLTENTLQEREGELRKFEHRKSQLEKELAVIFQEERVKRELTEKLKEENLNAQDEMEKMKCQLELIDRELEDLEVEIKNQRTQALTKEESLLKINSQINEIAQRIEKKRKLLFNLSTELANRKNYLQSQRKNLETSQNRLSNLNQRKEDLSQTLKRLEGEREELLKKIDSFRNLESERTEEIKERIKKIEENDRVLKEAGKSLIEEKKKEASLLGKIDALKSEIYENQGEEDSLIEYFQVEEEAEALVELLLEEKLKAKVIDSIEKLENQKGRKYYFQLNSHNGNVKKSEIPNGQRLSKFIKVKERGIEAIFENVCVVNDIKEAFELKRGNPSLTLVTKNGEVLYSDGFIKIGKSVDLLKKRRILNQSKEELEETQRLIESLEREISEKKEENERLKLELENKKIELSSLKMDAFKAQEKLKILTRDIEGFKQKIKYTENEEKAMLHEIEQSKKSIGRIQQEIEEVSNSIEETEEEMEGLRKEQETLNEESNRRKEELSEARIGISTLNERLKNKKLEAERLKELIEKTSKKIKDNIRQIEFNSYKLIELNREKEEKAKEIEIITQTISSLNGQIDSSKEEINSLRNSLDQLELKINEINAQIGNLTGLLAEKRIIERELKFKLENLWNEIYNLYGKDILKEEIEIPSDLELKRTRIKQLKTQLKELGPVDMEILREYNQVKERLEFLQSQQRDVKTSIEELELAIRKISSITKKKLRETYEALKEKFNSVFQELFDGGKAELILSDENNVLDSELDIVVQPPGKKLSNINLLSGGERTLTAVAFVFACLSIKPSPLCILDEVDAPLDDPNTMRLRKLIKRLSEQTQFLIITHNKLIMEAADYIYGVTMQEEGVSSILSLELKEAEVYA